MSCGFSKVFEKTMLHLTGNNAPCRNRIEPGITAWCSVLVPPVAFEIPACRIAIACNTTRRSSDVSPSGNPTVPAGANVQTADRFLFNTPILRCFLLSSPPPKPWRSQETEPLLLSPSSSREVHDFESWTRVLNILLVAKSYSRLTATACRKSWWRSYR